MKKALAISLLVAVLCSAPAVADLAFGYHITQVGQVAFLMQEGIEDLGGNIYYYKPDGIMIAYMSTDAGGVSTDEMYDTIIADPQGFSTGVLTDPEASLYPLYGGDAIKITGTPSAGYAYTMMYIIVHNEVISTIVFLAPATSRLTGEEFAYCARDYINTVHFIEK